MRKGKLSITQVLWMFGLIPLLCVGIVSGTTSTSTMKSELEDACYDKLYMAASDMGMYYSKELAKSGSIEYDTTYVDSHVGDDVELTLFIGDTRYITSIKDSSGNRNEGTTCDAEIYKTVSAGSDYSSKNVVISNSNYYVYYTPIYDADGAFYGMAFAGAPQAEIEQVEMWTQVNQLVVILGVSIIFIILIQVYSKKLRHALQGTRNVMAELASGNVGVVVDAQSTVKEIVDIINAADLLQQKLSESIGSVKTTASDLDGSVETVDDLSENSALGAEQIRQAVNDLAITATTMAETVQNANANIVEMGDAISDISDKVKTMADDSNRMLNINDETMLFMNKVQTSTAKAVEAIENIGNQTRNTNEAVEKIKSAAEIIAEIADQTNLLSLNASIEAARAGEAGKGFAVVADNIKQLAEQSAESANSIQTVVDEIVTLSAESVTLTTDTVDIIKEQEECINETVVKIKDLNDAVHQIVENVEAIDSETERLDASKEGVLDNIQGLSAISQENAASSEEVTANMESIANGIEGTKDQSREMRNMAEELMAKIDYFH